MISAKVIADSMNSGHRITTLELVYPRFIHSEFLTHRMFSRNSASSRAIPVEKMIEAVMNNPVIPEYWGKNQTGMEAQEELTHHDLAGAKKEWLRARDSAVEHVRMLLACGLHKQITNRLLEPWLHIHTVVTATEWENFFKLRISSHAQPEMRKLAEAMLSAMECSSIKFLTKDEWHVPYVSVEEMNNLGVNNMLRCSVARCARVSYVNHGDSKPNTEKDFELHDKLLKNGHMSPFEHQATPLNESSRHSNVTGWRQYRQVLGK